MDEKLTKLENQFLEIQREIQALDDKLSLLNPKKRLQFFQKDCVSLARDLIGKKLVHLKDGKLYSGIIVETEAYLGPEDKASHTYNHKQTEKNRCMYLGAPYIYLYLSHRGKNPCFNINCKDKGQSVLIRALEPLETLNDVNKYKLANGPGKLCQYMKFEMDLNGKTILNDNIYVEDTNLDVDIVSTPRINVGYSEEWAPKLLRFCDTNRTKFLSYPWKTNDLNTKMIYENPYDQIEKYQDLMKKSGHKYFLK